MSAFGQVRRPPSADIARRRRLLSVVSTSLPVDLNVTAIVRTLRPCGVCHVDAATISHKVSSRFLKTTNVSSGTIRVAQGRC